MAAMVFFAWVTASPIEAAVLRSGDDVVIAADETIEDDLYISGRNVRVEGRIHGDLLIAARDVVVTGPVSGDLMVASEDLRLDGAIGGSLRAAASSIVISGRIGDDAVLATGDLLLSPQAVVSHDLLLAAGEASLAGAVNGEALVRASELVVIGSVARLDFEGGALELQNGARVETLRYQVEREATLAPGARIGSAERLPPATGSGLGPVMALLMWGRTLLGLLAFGALLLLLAPRVWERVSVRLRRAPGASLAIGLASLLAGAVASLVIFAVGLAVGGWWIGVAFAFLLLLAVPVSLVLTSLAVGRVLLQRSPKGAFVSFALGALALAVIGAVPFLGQLVLLLATFAGLGALVLEFIATRRAAAARSRTLPPESPPMRPSAPPPHEPPRPMTPATP